MRKVVVYGSKSGMYFILDRTDGSAPLGIDEVPVPQDERQKTWPTQPFPRQGQWTEHKVVDQPLGTAVPGDPNRADHASIARHGWRRRTSARSPGSCRSRHPVWP